MTDLTPVMNAAVALLTAIITAFVIPWLRRKTTAQDREEMLKWVEIAVAAAQQLYHDLNGAARKQYVVDFLAGKGYFLEDKEVDNAIEAAVLKLHHELNISNAVPKNVQCAANPRPVMGYSERGNDNGNS